MYFYTYIYIYTSVCMYVCMNELHISVFCKLKLRRVERETCPWPGAECTKIGDLATPGSETFTIGPAGAAVNTQDSRGG